MTDRNIPTPAAATGGKAITSAAEAIEASARFVEAWHVTRTYPANSPEEIAVSDTLGWIAAGIRALRSAILAPPPPPPAPAEVRGLVELVARVRGAAWFLPPDNLRRDNEPSVADLHAVCDLAASAARAEGAAQGECLDCPGFKANDSSPEHFRAHSVAEFSAAQPGDGELRLRAGLVALYDKHGLAIATLCDEYLDRSGALLGEIRDAALAARRKGK